MNICMIRIDRPPFLADDALLYFLGQATSSSALRERPLFLAGADPRPTSEKCQERSLYEAALCEPAFANDSILRAPDPLKDQARD